MLERFPGLRFVQLEHELGWIPFFMDRLDYVYRERPMMITHRFADGSVPTDYLHHNVYHSFQEDALGMRDRGIIGVDNLLWGSDYPHLESTFPRSREILARVMAGGKRRRPGADDSDKYGQAVRVLEEGPKVRSLVNSL